MYTLAVLAALFSAFLDASSAVLQRRVTGQVAAKDLFRRRVMSDVIRRQLWIAGVGLQVLAFFAQAVALREAPLVLVAPLLTTDLVFLLLLIHFVLKVRISRRAWMAMLVLALGLSGLLVGTSPQGGHVPVDITLWTVIFAIIGTAVVAGAIGIRRIRSVKLRAAAAGVVAGLHFGLTGAVTKLVVEQLQYGFWHLFVGWELYALIIVGSTAVISMQSMYGAGSLAISQPAVEISVTVEGILVGLFLFGDSISTDAGSLVMTSLGFILLAVGVVMLSRVEQTPDVSAVH